MHHILFLQDLAVVMIVAALATIIFRQFKQPVVLGYIVAGVIIGPHTPPFALVADEKTIETLAELGVIFLMFTLGLEFSLRKLKKVGATAFVAASLEIVLMIWAGYELGQLFGWNQMDSIFLGAILSISSTTIIIKALEGLGKTREKFAQLIFGILIIEDILAILMIAILSGFATKGEFVLEDVSFIILNLAAFMGILLVVGLIAVPRLLNYVAKFKSNEMLLITVVGLCFGVSFLTVKLGYSVALGAFLIGAIVAEARQISKIETLMFPVRDLFSAVFFVSIGLLINPSNLIQYILPILAITIVVIVGKVIACSIGCFISGNDTKTSIRVGMGLAQIGEFSFIIAALGLTLNVTSDFIYPIAVAVSALTTLSTPYLINSSDTVSKWFEKIAPRPLLRTMEAYSQWISGPAKEDPNNWGKVFLRKICLQILLNLLIVTGIFLSFVFLNEKISFFISQYLGIEVTKAILWFAAIVISFPIIFAIWKKMQAVGMVIGELSVSTEDESKSATMRAVVSNTIFILGTMLLILVILLLSSTLLPSKNILLLSLILIIIAGIFLYPRSVKLYVRARFALQDTFDTPADPKEQKEKSIMNHPLLEDVKLEAEKIQPDTIAAGKMISELKLRTETGASIIGIERGEDSIVNPESDEELNAGDHILLLGYEDQIAAAKKFISSPPEKKQSRKFPVDKRR
ncbi:MAG: cation:proton antiporter [Bacteroidota bacterium]|nr:cation:proton antiporter [Bacteroidota bacterium]